MAASENPPQSDRPASGGGQDARGEELADRLEEEIARSEREGTRLSCLLVVIDNLRELASEHGEQLREQTLDYVAVALRKGLRRFDRVGPSPEGELLVILPGADSPSSELVARRALERLRAIKVEAMGGRLALHISVGMACWREGASAGDLLADARAALRSVSPENGAAHPAPAQEGAPRARTGVREDASPPVGGPGGS